MEKQHKWATRSSGILLPLSCLPSKYGIGSFGLKAREWIDFLHAAKQSYWQILPLSQTGFGDSPYQSFSAFAGNPYFIELDDLKKQGLLDESDYIDIKWSNEENRVDYYTLFKHREKILKKAFLRFTDNDALDKYAQKNKWLENYALYMVIKTSQDHRPWIEWDEPLRQRQQDVIDRILHEHAEDIRYHFFVQYQFDIQWKSLRDYAREKGVQIIGDIPIYVSMDSADAWAYPEMYQLDENKVPREVSGCPPDSFAADGQLWGNPLYDWDKMAETGFSWWIERFHKCFELYDVIRLDHFRGLESYFAIPYGDLTAANGVWKPGPGNGFINAINENIPDAKIIAEDLGYLTPEVYELLKYSGYPGMKITQYAFDDREAGDYYPHNYDQNSIVYPGTHDNDTLKGWVETAPNSCIQDAIDYTGIENVDDLPNAMIRLTFQAPSLIAVIPMQDWLGLGSEARFNTPSTVGGSNWCWRMDGKEMNTELASKIAKITTIFRRAAKGEQHED